MGAESGRAFLLKIGNGGSPVAYATVAGLRTTQLSINGEMVAITSKDSGGWRELLSGAGVRSVSVSGAGCSPDRRRRCGSRAMRSPGRSTITD